MWEWHTLQPWDISMCLIRTVELTGYGGPSSQARAQRLALSAWHEVLSVAS